MVEEEGGEGGGGVGGRRLRGAAGRNAPRLQPEQDAAQ